MNGPVGASGDGSGSRRDLGQGRTEPHEPNPYAAVAAIVARIPLDVASREMTDAFRSEIPAIERLSDASRDDILAGVQRNMRRWCRWLTTGVTPQDSDFDPLRDWARARAGEGVRIEDLLRALAVGRQIGWELIRRYARSDETDAVLEAAGLLMRYVDRVSTDVADTYLAERDALVSEEERRTRDLLEHLGSGASLDLRERELAERLGVTVEPAYAPFAIVMPGRPPRRHAALAARLRRGGWKLTVTDGSRVVGLALTPPGLPDLGEGADIVLATAAATPRAELAAAREDAVLLAEHGRQAGLRGRIRAEDHLIEILMSRSPGPAARLRTRVLGPVADPDHKELLRTIRAFVSHNYDRAATSEALHVHRNTLGYRLRRIEEITGLDFTSARDLACVYLATAVSAVQPAQP